MTASRESLHTLRAVGVLTLRSSQCLNIFENWMSRSRILQLQKNVVHRKDILNFVRNPQGLFLSQLTRLIPMAHNDRRNATHTESRIPVRRHNEARQNVA